MLVLLGLLIPGAVHAQTDSLTLEESVLVGRRNQSVIEVSPSGASLQTDRLKAMPMLLGSSDPVRLARYLPSMQASTELDHGLHIQGNDHSHNLVSSGGVPIYGAAHLLGIFSVFNPSHFESFEYSTWARESNRLGGQLEMALPGTAAEKVGGDFSLGLIHFQGGIRVPIGKSSLAVSLRRSYVNLLYGHFMKIGSTPLGYGFTDANLTWQWRPTEQDRIWIDAYYGDDKASMSSASKLYGVDIQWGNAMGAVHWQHSLDGSGSLHQTAYATTYYLNPFINYSGMDVKIPSSILTAGYKARWTNGTWSAGGDFAAHRAHPQDVSISGSFNTTHAPQPLQHGQELSLFASYSGEWGPLSLSAGLRGLLWHSPDGRWMPDAGPDLQLSWNFYDGGKLSARAGIQHQYLMQAGITDLGLPCEFWFLAGTFNDPQHSLGTTLTYTLPFAGDMFTFQAEAYYRTLSNQVEYRNGFIDLIYSPSSMGDALLKGDGRAFGASVMLHKRAGSFTGWVSYAWGRSLRRFEGIQGEVPSAHERLHELDVVASYSIGKWSFGLTYLLAAGTPYTPPVGLYVLSNRVVVQYGEHNSARLNPYNRLDLAVNYYFNKGGRTENGLNLSVYNAIGARNELYRNLVIDEDGFAYAPSDINIRFMPSICYFHKF